MVAERQAERRTDDSNREFVTGLRIVIGALVTSLLVLGVTGLLNYGKRLDDQHVKYVRLRAEFDAFRAGSGNRWTRSQGLETRNTANENRRRLEEIEQRQHDLVEDYRTHVAWGKQWSVDATRRIEENEKAVRRYQWQGPPK